MTGVQFEPERRRSDDWLPSHRSRAISTSRSRSLAPRTTLSDAQNNTERATHYRIEREFVITHTASATPPYTRPSQARPRHTSAHTPHHSRASSSNGTMTQRTQCRLRTVLSVLIVLAVLSVHCERQWRFVVVVVAFGR